MAANTFSVSCKRLNETRWEPGKTQNLQPFWFPQWPLACRIDFIAPWFAVCRSNLWKNPPLCVPCVCYAMRVGGRWRRFIFTMKWRPSSEWEEKSPPGWYCCYHPQLLRSAVCMLFRFGSIKNDRYPAIVCFGVVSLCSAGGLKLRLPFSVFVSFHVAAMKPFDKFPTTKCDVQILQHITQIHIIRC